MTDWQLSGDCVEGCTSPPVCPYYWGSSVQKDLHDGKDQCEGTFTFNIKEGYYNNIALSGLVAGIGFNTPADGHKSKNPWAAALYVDENADDQQFKAIAEIFRISWARVGMLSKAKRAEFVFEKEAIGKTTAEGYRFRIECMGIYKLETEPLLTKLGQARFISGLENGIIYVGKSIINRFRDADLPRGIWDCPGMSNTYFGFIMNRAKLDWVP